MPINLSEESMRDIEARISDAADTAWTKTTQLIESMEKTAKKVQVYKLIESINSFITAYNDEVKTTIKNVVDMWHSSQAGVENAVKNADPNNHDGIATAAAFDNRVANIIDETFTAIPAFSCATPNPIIDQVWFDGISAEFSAAYNTINDEFENVRGIFEQAAENGEFMYSTNLTIVNTVMMAHTSAFSSAATSFRNMGEELGLQVKAAFNAVATVHHTASAAVGQLYAKIMNEDFDF